MSISDTSKWMICQLITKGRDGKDHGSYWSRFIICAFSSLQLLTFAYFYRLPGWVQTLSFSSYSVFS